jgi:uncharacterized iron-regulated protein
MRRLLLALVLAAGCGGRYPAKTAHPTPHGDDGEPRGVPAAALPYSIVDGRTGSAVTADDFWKALGASKVVCVGEDHPNPHHHWAQLEVVSHLAKKGFGLGMEMVQRPFQAVLDDYRGGRIDAAALQSRVGWEDRWGYEFSMYQPVIDAAVAKGGALVALNAAEEVTKKVAHHGLASLSSDERASIAKDLVLDDKEHRAWFDGVMADMGGAEAHSSGEETGDTDGMPSADDVYTVQVIWDETMAESAAQWIDQGGDQMVVLAGNGHCHDSAIVRRVARRGVTPVVSVRPIIDDGQGNVAEAIQEKRNDYLFVMTMPTE